MRKQSPGSLRIGVRRELKKSLGAFEKGEAAFDRLHDRTRDVRQKNGKIQKVAGLASSPWKPADPAARILHKKVQSDRTIIYLSLAPAFWHDLERKNTL